MQPDIETPLPVRDTPFHKPVEEKKKEGATKAGILEEELSTTLIMCGDASIGKRTMLSLWMQDINIEGTSDH